MSEQPEKTSTPGIWKRFGNMLARVILYGLLLYVLLMAMGIWPLELVFHVIAGSLLHAWKNLPPFFGQWRSALLPLACLTVAIALAHRFIRWWIHAKGIQMTWHWKHTAAAASLLLLGSAAAIAMSGITHQAAWLASSPWLQSNHRPHMAIAVNNARMIMLALSEYETEHGKYPETLKEVAKVSDLPPSMLWIIPDTGRPREPFIFLKPCRPSSGLIEPVLASPVIQTDKVVVGYSDNRVRTMPFKAWLRLKAEIQAANE